MEIETSKDAVHAAVCDRCDRWFNPGRSATDQGRQVDFVEADLEVNLPPMSIDAARMANDVLAPDWVQAV